MQSGARTTITTHVQIVTTLATLSFCLLMSVPVQAGDESHCGIDAHAVGQDIEALFRAPGDWDTGHWVAAGAIGVVSTGLVLRWDQVIYRHSVESPTSFPYVIVNKLAWLGSWYGHNNLAPLLTIGAVAGGFAIAGATKDDDRLMRTAGVLTESYLFTSGITIAVKLLAGRSRPYTNDDARKWRFIGFHRREARSFPSGHTSGAFSMATVISKRHQQWYAQIPAWTLAAGVAAQRIDSGAHWASDTLIGAAIGYSVSALLTDRHTCDGASSGASTTSYFTVGFDF